MTLAGLREAAGQFNPTLPGFVTALGWFLLALILSEAVQSMAVGLPSTGQLAVGILIQAATVAVLALATAQSLHFLKLGVPLTALLTPIIYLMALVRLMTIPLLFLGPGAQLLALLVLVVLIWRAAMVLAGMRTGVAIAYAALCLMVLVAVPYALYIVFVQIPSPA